MVAMNVDSAYHMAPHMEMEKVQQPDNIGQQNPEPQEARELPHQIKPIHGFDTYVPEDKTLHESIGIYRVVDNSGTPKVEFDGPKQKEEETSNVTTTNTDDVDREIERLKEKREQLASQIGRESDPQRKEELERELAQVEQELTRKDNDTYRRQHADIS